ncbi:unnamed protein product [Owenia fusiformis]|uniref:Uncharacterized protein n=1 Tax=Owenia fusiformis TaxID=6347 RepID=A0A8J1U6A2_OWEFU|nr:unnamed protein product [Owenia fusiformis]
MKLFLKKLRPLVRMVTVTLIVALMYLLLNHLEDTLISNTSDPFVRSCDFISEIRATAVKYNSANTDSTLLQGQSLGINTTRIAIGCAIKIREMDLQKDDISHLPLFVDLLPSFCSTMSKGFIYEFYFAHDYNDTFFIGDAAYERFNEIFNGVLKNRSECHKFEDIEKAINVHFVKCQYSGKPAWAQNDAMMAAHADNMTFFYRINDDTILQTSGWTEQFIATLSTYKPPLIGVVGPNHKGGKLSILTYDFVHRHHIDIFGFYYPRELSAWYADDWITRVYEPSRSLKLRNIKLFHTKKLGIRYDRDKAHSKMLPKLLKRDRKVLQTYLKTHPP